jgi:arabinofuranosyltransferase
MFRSTSRIDKFLILALLIFISALLFRTAWVGDDVYITLRTVDNFVHGYGLRWNIAERVQSYTHPLWMFMLIPVYAGTQNAYFTALFLSFLFTALTFLLVAFQSNAPFTLLLLSLSKAFLDFSVSGLENPATHFLVLVFILIFLKSDHWTRREIFLLSLIVALTLLNRMDTALFFIPALVYLLYRQPSRWTIGSLALGFLPFVLWELFSLFYYGFLFPNTAYAKLGNGISSIDLIRQGWVYYVDSFSRDPVTLTVIIAGLALVLWKGGQKERLVAIGVILYLCYIVKIGGDFMSGRFFSAPFFIAVVLLARVFAKTSVYLRVSVAGLAMLMSLAAPYPLLLFRSDQPAYTKHDEQTGIYDERAFYKQSSGLLTVINSDGQSLVSHPWSEQGLNLHELGRIVVQKESVGFTGYFAGPKAHIVDVYAICDPLLARLPTKDREEWRIGHFERAVPHGYFKTLRTGTNYITDPNLAAYYDKLSTITRGALQSPERLRVIWKMNTGQYDYLIDEYLNSLQQP